MREWATTGKRRGRRRRRGSALMMAIVTTTLLFIIGVAFLLNSRMYKESVSNVETAMVLDDAIEVVVDRINTVLVEDIVDGTGNVLSATATTPGTNEPWDYPYSNSGALGQNDDTWLASLEPELDPTGTYYFWRHITDLYSNDFNISTVNPGPYYDPEDRDIASIAQWDGSALSDWYRFNPGNWILNYPRIVRPDEGTEVIVQGGAWDNPDDVCLWGARADADGDGVVDSRWVRIANFAGPGGQNCYAAVRIVDNGGMININTAYRDPTNLTTTPGDWDGSRLSHVNLEGIRATGDAAVPVSEFQEERCGAVYAAGEMADEEEYDNDTQYEDDVAMRLLNPYVLPSGNSYSPFDMGDELELRNRFFVTSPVKNRFGYYIDASTSYLWQVTFDPQANPGRSIPFEVGENLYNWFYKVNNLWSPTKTSNIYYNRRHIATTYNFDRVMVSTADYSAMPTELKTAWEAWNQWNQPREQWRFRPICVNDVGGLGANDPTVEQLAAAIWMGLADNPLVPPDYYGFDAVPPGYSWPKLTRDDLACQLAVNLLDYIDIDPTCADIDFTDGGGATHTYYGYEANQDVVYISEIAKAEYEDASGPVHCYAIELFYPGGASPTLSGIWEISINGAPGVSISGATFTGGMAVLTDTDNPVADPATIFGVTGTPTAVAGIGFVDGDRIILLNDGRPVDAIETGTPIFNTGGVVGASDAQSLERGDWFIDGEVPVWDTTATAWNSGNTLGVSFIMTGGAYPANRARVQISARDDDEMPTIGELSLVLGIGSCTVTSGGTTTYQSLPEWFDAYRAGADISDIAAGRIDCRHPDFANLTRYLTVDGFNPFSDAVDNDGDGKNDDPEHDGEDNNYDGTIDDAAENDPRYMEYSELAVAGRLNINTAPWFVIAQLPWIQDPSAVAADQYKLANAIVAYRDMLDLEALWGAGAPDYSVRHLGMGYGGPIAEVREFPGFVTVGELLNVTQNIMVPIAADPYYDIRRYGRDTVDNDVALNTGPMYDALGDGVTDDLEERDVVFSRVSNLVTVRSDVFTAYILVRLGERGPQKRVIAVFDRSNVYGGGDVPRLVGLHPVPGT